MIQTSRVNISDFIIIPSSGFVFSDRYLVEILSAKVRDFTILVFVLKEN